MIDQVAAAIAGPHGWATTITWVVAGIAAAIALVHAVRPGPGRRRWSRAAAVGLPLAIVGVLLVGSVAPALHGRAFDVAMLLRMTGFWTALALAPLAVGQVVGLRPPRWLTRTSVALAAGFLLLLVTTDLVFVGTDGYDPDLQFGPLAVPFLFPAGALVGWWLWSCLQQLQTRSSQWLFAAGAAATTLALASAGLVLEPAVADHLLVVGLLPLLGVTQLVEGQRVWRHRTATRAPGHRHTAAQ
jgi:hypothetical protein